MPHTAAAARPIVPPSPMLPPRPRDSHKGDFGNVGILGGSPGMAGAALLCARAALLLGAGRVYAGLLDDRIGLDFQAPEIMVCAPQRICDLDGPGCLVAGPGLGQTQAARDWLARAMGTPLPLLVDADGLNLMAADHALADALARRQAPTLLTPHPGEAARLLGTDIPTIQQDRERAIGQIARRYRAGVILKGAGSLVHFPDRPVWLNSTGNPGLAAPGMGDVLAGIIAALAAQGMDMEAAACLGVHLHGSAADDAVQEGLGPYGLTAGEVIQATRRRLNAGINI